MVAALACALAAAAPARAQAGEPSPLAGLPWANFSGGEPGTWVEYATLVGGHPVGPYLRLLLAGTEPVEGGVGTWIEIWISQRPGSATQAFRLLVAGDPSRPGGIRKARVRLLGGRIQDVPPEDLLQGAETADRATALAGLDGATHQVTSVLTAAGSFEARLATVGRSGQQTKVWLSPSVPILSLVRLEIAGRTGLELHAMGKDGRGVVEDEPLRPAAAAAQARGGVVKDESSRPAATAAHARPPSASPEETSPLASPEPRPASTAP